MTTTREIDLTKIHGKEFCVAVTQLMQVTHDKGQSLTVLEIDGKRMEVVYLSQEDVVTA